MPLNSSPSPPSDDKRWKLVDSTMRRNGHESHALIEVLHTVQETFGFLDKEALRYVATSLRVPLSKVYGVATFYHYFSMKPQGKHTCVVCTGTACYIKGAQALLDSVKAVAEIRPGETTRDHKVSLVTARCLGSCGLAPAVVFDGKVTGKIGPADIAARIGEWTK
jgi:bidirectional [NiFe] hydrogenase diaphorase subunit